MTSLLEPSSPIADVLRSAPTTVVEGHLNWLVTQAHLRSDVSPSNTLLRTQARILITALDERGDFEAVQRALSEPWVPEDVPDEESKILDYVERLVEVSAGRPADSPQAALARSAERIAADIVSCRGKRLPENLRF
ncbi:MAG TPA: hypothetical protein VEJ87_08275 [Acidimicrobiales bacterium]|nr:hypothetical protein [Acidimicrobiales bacterium]